MSGAIIEICTDNDAFVENGTSVEIVKILKDLCESIENGEIRIEKILRDTNGNTVGKFVYHLGN